MTFDLKTILESKRTLRRELGARPIGEKLRILDALRERSVLLRGATESRAQQKHVFRNPKDSNT